MQAASSAACTLLCETCLWILRFGTHKASPETWNSVRASTNDESSVRVCVCVGVFFVWLRGVNGEWIRKGRAARQKWLCSSTHFWYKRYMFKILFFYPSFQSLLFYERGN